MATFYIYSLTRNFGGSVDASRLASLIAAQGAIGIASSSIVILGDNVQIHFARALSGSEKSALDAVVAAYSTVQFPRFSRHFTLWSLYEEYPVGTNAGTAESGWQTRTLNTLRGSQRPYVSLNNNRFTLTSGTYTIFASAPAYRARNHRLRLYNHTAARADLIGESNFSQNSQTTATLSGLLLLTRGPQTFSLDHYCSQRRTNSGLGVAVGAAGTNEQYAHVRIQKVQ